MFLVVRIDGLSSVVLGLPGPAETESETTQLGILFNYISQHNLGSQSRQCISLEFLFGEFLFECT